MDQITRKLVKYILWELTIFLLLALSITYLGIFFEFGEIQNVMLGILPKVIVVILIILIAKLAISVTRPVFDKAFEKRLPSHADIEMIWQFIANMTWIFILMLIILIFIGTVDLLAIGVILAALIWALQKPILTLAGWMVIISRRPYTIGDRIEVDGKKGYVVDVGMFYTTLREIGEWMNGDTFTGRLLNIPNSCVFEKPVLNYTRDTPYIWDEVKIAITYESDYDLAKHHIQSGAVEIIGFNMKKYARLMTQKMEIKDLKKELIQEPVIMSEFSDYCVNFYVIYYCEAMHRRAIRSAITERVLNKIMKDDKVRIAYPHMELVGLRKE